MSGPHRPPSEYAVFPPSTSRAQYRRNRETSENPIALSSSEDSTPARQRIAIPTNPPSNNSQPPPPGQCNRGLSNAVSNTGAGPAVPPYSTPLPFCPLPGTTRPRPDYNTALSILAPKVNDAEYAARYGPPTPQEPRGLAEEYALFRDYATCHAKRAQDQGFSESVLKQMGDRLDRLVWRCGPAGLIEYWEWFLSHEAGRCGWEFERTGREGEGRWRRWYVGMREARGRLVLKGGMWHYAEGV